MVCHLFQLEGEPCQHTGRHTCERGLSEHPGKTFLSFRKHFSEHAAAACQISPAVTVVSPSILLFFPYLSCIYVEVDCSKSMHAQDSVSRYYNN